jgi:hypothetical protein
MQAARLSGAPLTCLLSALFDYLKRFGNWAAIPSLSMSAISRMAMA